MKKKIMILVAIAAVLLMVNSTLVAADGIHYGNIENENQLEIMKVTDSGSLWKQINEDGFGNKENAGVRGIQIFNGSVVIGTASFTGDIALDESMPLKDFYFEYFKNRSALDNFKSNGCEIWAYNGTSVRPIVAKNGIMERGFGNKNNVEVGFLINFGDYLYAGTRNYPEGCHIWRTDSLDSEWECIVGDGFGNIKNSWAMEAHIFKDHLYIGTFNMDDGTEIYRTNDGVNWTQLIGKDSSVKNGFDNKDNFYTWSMCEYNDNLYVGTNNNEYGGELWKSNDGVNWTPIISDAEGALYPLDFTETGGYHGGIRNMVLYKNELYVGFTTEDTPFTFGLKNFERLKISIPGALPSLINIYRRMKTIGLEIYKFNDSTNELTTVIGGVRRGVFSGGFGDDCNEYPWSMHVYNDTLYVGTSHVQSYDAVFERIGFLKWAICVRSPVGGAEIWKYDGTRCEQINSDGFGDLSNIGVREMIVYNDKLIAGVFNVKTGCELWELEL